MRRLISMQQRDVPNGPPNPYPAPGQAFQPQPIPVQRRRHPVLSHAAVAVVALAVGVGIGSSGSSTSASPGQAAPAATSQAAPPATPAAAPPSTTAPAANPATHAASVSTTVSGDGQYLVGTDMQPGTYRTAGPAANSLGLCYWERDKNASGDFDSIIANDSLSGSGVVTVNHGEYFKSSGCQDWTRVG